MYQTTYFVLYSAICGLLTAGLGATLHWTCNLFLRDRFSRNPKRMLSVARLLALGFYAVCCGYFAMSCPTNWQYASLADVAHVISCKAGFFLLLLGTMEILNLLILVVFKNRLEEEAS